ncbi:hypothetical protein M5689_013883 [Euphorbia peplus]|nr:hypothetical protein M5689_013883 [Euphorbia peplus]
MHVGNLQGTLVNLNPQVINLMELAKRIHKQCFEVSNQIEMIMDTLTTNPTLDDGQYHSLIELQTFRTTTHATLTGAMQVFEAFALLNIDNVDVYVMFSM